MTQHSKTTIERHLRQIADMLVLNGTLTFCPGLVHGKTRIAIFFFHYAQYTRNELFSDYALDLIGEIQNQISVNSFYDYERGIAGVGIGIDYLINNMFLEADNNIFEDFDQRMYRAVMYDPCQNFSKYNELIGYGRYWISRLRDQVVAEYARECLVYVINRIKENLPKITTSEQSDVYCFLHDLQETAGFDVSIELMEQSQKQSANGNQSFSCLDNSIFGHIVGIYQYSRYFNNSSPCEIDVSLIKMPDLDVEKPPVSMGLLTGFTGEGLLRLTALKQIDNSWMFLL